MIRTREGELRLGPDDDGVALELDAFERAELVPGHRYELVAGRLSVSPAPEFPHEVVSDWFLDRLKEYARAHPDRLKRVFAVSRTIARAHGASTNVQPDIAGYRDLPASARSWRDVSPVLVIEVLSDSTAHKDLVRNRDVYWQVPSIQEYWIVDGRDERAAPSMLALERGPEGWIERPVASGATYRTELLPGLALDLSQVG
jgi:Uma2 family endonuclease